MAFFAIYPSPLLPRNKIAYSNRIGNLVSGTAFIQRIGLYRQMIRLLSESLAKFFYKNFGFRKKTQPMDERFEKAKKATGRKTINRAFFGT